MGGSYQTLESGSGVADQVVTCVRVRVIFSPVDHKTFYTPFFTALTSAHLNSGHTTTHGYHGTQGDITFHPLSSAIRRSSFVWTTKRTAEMAAPIPSAGSF